MRARTNLILIAVCAAAALWVAAAPARAQLTPEQRRSLPDTAIGQVVFTEKNVWGL